MGLRKHLSGFFEDRSGATAVEYSLVVALVGLVIMAGATQMRGGIDSVFSKIETNLDLNEADDAPEDNVDVD